MTAPWMSRAADDVLASTLDCPIVIEAVHPTLGARRLDIVTAQLSWDESRSPHVLLHGAVAYSAEAIEALDARALVRIRISAGYVYPGRITDIHPVAELVLDTATIVRSAGAARIELDAFSDELLLEHVWQAPGPFTSATTYEQAVRAIIAAGAGQAAATAAAIDPSVAGLPILDAGETMALPLGSSLTTALRELSDRVGALAYHDGLTGWKARPAAATPGAVAAIVTGRRGLATATQSQRDRGSWGNAVATVYRWRDAAGTEHEVIGRAQQLTGPLGVETIGRKPLNVVRSIPTSLSAANTAAASILARALARGRAVAVEAARAVWWVRPGSTITVSTPDDPPRPAIVASVTFDLPAATMHVRTRIPEEA